MKQPLIKGVPCFTKTNKQTRAVTHGSPVFLFCGLSIDRQTEQGTGNRPSDRTERAVQTRCTTYTRIAKGAFWQKRRAHTPDMALYPQSSKRPEPHTSVASSWD